jgi:DnaJ-class molecular chaperone
MPSSPSKTGGGGAKKGRDFYEILGVERTANQGQIKQSYRKLAMKHHPDKNPGDEVASEKFKEVSTAYSVLSDPNTKRQYDLHGEEG